MKRSALGIAFAVSRSSHCDEDTTVRVVSRSSRRVLTVRSRIPQPRREWHPPCFTELWSRPVNVERAVDENDGIQSYPNLEVTKDDKILVVTHTHEIELIAADSGKTLHRPCASNRPS